MEWAKALRVPVQRVNTLINGTRGVTAETALLLAEQFRTTPEFWMNLQSAYDLRSAKQHHGDQITQEVTPRIQVTV